MYNERIYIKASKVCCLIKNKHSSFEDYIFFIKVIELAIFIKNMLPLISFVEKNRHHLTTDSKSMKTKRAFTNNTQREKKLIEFYSYPFVQRPASARLNTST